MKPSSRKTTGRTMLSTGCRYLNGLNERYETVALLLSPPSTAVAACAHSCKQRLKIQPTITKTMLAGVSQRSGCAMSANTQSARTVRKAATINQLTEPKMVGSGEDGRRREGNAW